MTANCHGCVCQLFSFKTHLSPSRFNIPDTGIHSTTTASQVAAPTQLLLPAYRRIWVLFPVTCLENYSHSCFSQQTSEDHLGGQ